MAGIDYFKDHDVSRLISWQGDLDCAFHALEWLVDQLAEVSMAEGLGCALPIVSARVRGLIDGCPFPPRAEAEGPAVREALPSIEA